jgi:hypothetical protein
MHVDRLSRHLLTAFLLALGLYAAGYWLIESRRTVQTPWVVGFETDAGGKTRLFIRQESLGLGPVEIELNLPGTNPPLARTEIFFAKPEPVPFATPVGRCVFLDTTFLPGTVALDVAGVKLQMLPRALTVGTNEFSWGQVPVVEVAADGSVRAGAARPHR